MRVALFIPCLMDRFMPEAAISTTRMLESVGVKVDYDPRQTCCGQPPFNAGYPDLSLPFARKLLRLFDGRTPVVSPSGSCVAMVRNHYGLLGLAPEELARWQLVRENIFELAEFIVGQGLLGELGATFEGRLVVHHSCHHLRHLHAAPPLLQLLGRLAGAELVESPEALQCCGFGGIFSARLPELSVRMGRERLAALAACKPAMIALADVGCILHLRGIVAAAGELFADLPPIVHYSQLFARDLGDLR